MPNLTERIKLIATNVMQGDTSTTGPSFQDQLETFKNEVTQQIDELRTDLHTLIEDTQHQHQQGN